MKIAEIRGNREKRKARLGAGRGPGPAPPGAPFEYVTNPGANPLSTLSFLHYFGCHFDPKRLNVTHFVEI